MCRKSNQTNIKVLLPHKVSKILRSLHKHLFFGWNMLFNNQTAADVIKLYPWHEIEMKHERCFQTLRTRETKEKQSFGVFISLCLSGIRMLCGRNRMLWSSSRSWDRRSSGGWLIKRSHIVWAVRVTSRGGCGVITAGGQCQSWVSLAETMQTKDANKYHHWEKFIFSQSSPQVF